MNKAIDFEMNVCAQCNGRIATPTIKQNKKY